MVELKRALIIVKLIEYVELSLSLQGHHYVCSPVIKVYDIWEANYRPL